MTVMEPRHVARPQRVAAWDGNPGWVWTAQCSCGWSWRRTSRDQEPAARAATVHAATAEWDAT